jgi:hypothetical protein
MSRLITKLKVGEEIIIDGIVRLHRPEGNDKLRLVIDSPIDLKIEKRIIPYDERLAKQKAQRK